MTFLRDFRAFHGCFRQTSKEMPWSVADVDRHKKGLSAEQKQKWSRIANSVLKRCLAGGGSQKTCEASAVRIANSHTRTGDGG